MVVPSSLEFWVQHTCHNTIHLDLIVCEFVGTVNAAATVTAAAAAAAAAAISNYRFIDGVAVVVVVNNSTFVFVPDFVDNKVYIIGLLSLCHRHSCW